MAGVLLMFFVLFLCAGGGDKYEPSGKTQGNRARLVSHSQAWSIRVYVICSCSIEGFL